jgi:hypothetical protein
VPTLEQALEQSDRDLKDFGPVRQFVNYPRELLLQWYNDGLCLLGRLRPDVFARPRIVTLSPGAEQQVEDCSVFGSAVAQVHPDGRDTPIRRTSYLAGQAWTKPSCRRPSDPYTVQGYRFDPTQKTTFYVEPPVPPGKEVKVKILCSFIPPELTLADLDQPLDFDCYQFAMVKHYVLSQAYAQDSDDTNFALAQYHLGIWNSFLPATARADAAFSGSNLPVPANMQQGGSRR